jgi:hypothetical protein
MGGVPAIGGVADGVIVSSLDGVGVHIEEGVGLPMAAGVAPAADGVGGAGMFS